MSEQQNKISIKDRLVSKLKNDAGEELLQKGGLALGTLYGMKRHNMNLSKALTTTGLVGGAAGTLAGGVGIGSVRLKRLHNKELGSNPNNQDYGKIIATNAIPAGIGFGIMAKNHDKLEHEANKAINIGKSLIRSKGKNIPAAIINKAQNIATHLNSSDIKGTLKNSNPKKLAVGAGILGLGAALEIPNMIISPETIVNKKKEGIKDMNKNAFEIVEEAYEKIAREAIPGTPQWEKDNEDKKKKNKKEEKSAFEIVEEAFDKIASIE